MSKFFTMTSKQSNHFVTLIFSLIILNSVQVFAQTKTVTLSSLAKNEMLHGFKTITIYLNDEDKPMGGRFIHEQTGFTLDLLQIESVPQTFIYTNTFPVSDMGEPHTQEHLLITKGNKGHELNTREGMSLAQSNAFTQQLYTAYMFNTGASTTVFYNLFQKYLDALLYPDYTDEEVHREVRNWGVSENPDKTLRIEEKGAVYNEMSTSMNSPYSLLYDSAKRIIFGKGHPISYNAGGLPSGIRKMNAADILKFHNDNYYLGNMGAIVSLAGSNKLDDVLSQINTILTDLNKMALKKTRLQKTLPTPQPEGIGTVSIINFPTQNAQQPGTIFAGWPAMDRLSTEEYILLNNFLTVFAGEASTNLYKLFVNSNTKNKEVDAQAVFGFLDNGPEPYVFIGLDGIKKENITKEKAAIAGNLIKQEFEKIAAFKDNSPELKEFNTRFQNSLTSIKRSFAKFVNSPPKFGFRNTGGEWYDQLQQVNQSDDFKKSVIMKPAFADIESMLTSGKNIWKTYLDKWKFTNSTPAIVMSNPDPALIPQAEAEKKERATAEIASLKAVYQLDDEQDIIKRYKAIYDSNSTVLAKMENAHQIAFIDNPPLTLDDQLIYHQQKLPGNIPMLASVFNNMTSATTGIAINLHGVRQNKLLYLALLPELLTQTGIIENGKAISYEDMSQKMQQEILELSSYYSNFGPGKRAELVVRGAGNNAAEAVKAVQWMNDVLQHPNWTKENLPRLRDLVQQQLSGMRNTMQQREEAWVRDPQEAYLYQEQPLQLATKSFLTKAFNILRLKWRLTSTEDKITETNIKSFLFSLAQANTNREDLEKLLQVMNSDENLSADSAGNNKSYAQAFLNLSPLAKKLAKEVAADLQQTLVTLPDNSLGPDWAFLCHTIQKDLMMTPEETLVDLNNLRNNLLKKDQARLFMIGSEKTEKQLTTAVNSMLSNFSATPTVAQVYSTKALIKERVKERMNSTETPLFVGLINGDSPTGVFMNTYPVATYDETSKIKQEKFLASLLYAGGGKESVYTKTTGAGLSYSTGVNSSNGSGLFQYYAERTPLLPQTLKFVIDEIKKAPFDPTRLDYIVALAVGRFRSASEYEVRGEAIASDLQDNLTAAKIKNFRQAILKLRKQPNVLKDIYGYKNEMYEKILPGYGGRIKEVKGATYLVIGPEKQMAAYEAYLKSVEGENTKLYRLYGRDFWMVDE